MGKLRRSPFKNNTVENDPKAFGLRVKETLDCFDALYNDRSILISGPRGIGKSSQGYQLQRVLQGDNTLLERCHVDEVFPKTLCLFYACDKEITLNQMALEILFDIQQECQKLATKRLAQLMPSLEVNLGVFKAKWEKQSKEEKLAPATVANQLAIGFEKALQTLGQFHVCDSINVMIDELDHLSPNINFGHFMKIVHETIASSDLKVTFILAGQQGVYSRLTIEDASFERIVRHIPLSVLDPEESGYVLWSASERAHPKFKYEDSARALLLSIAVGYPYVLHLIGDAAYMVMDDVKIMTKGDVLTGLYSILKSDKREKYLGRLKGLSDLERKLIIALSAYTAQALPAQIPMDWISKRLGHYFKTLDQLDEVLDALVQKGYLVIPKNREYARFGEELFRVFVSLARIEQQNRHKAEVEELDEARSRGEMMEEIQEYVQRKIWALITDLEEKEGWEWDSLDDEDRSRALRKISKMIEDPIYTEELARDDLTIDEQQQVLNETHKLIKDIERGEKLDRNAIMEADDQAVTEIEGIIKYSEYIHEWELDDLSELYE
jgi:hypothetical protein